jgi:hypothetical protein
MKIRLVGGLVGLAISFVLSTFAQQKDTADPLMRQQINTLDDKLTRRTATTKQPLLLRSSRRGSGDAARNGLRSGGHSRNGPP